ncbi:uncharacterized protein PAC_09612 [Phialocephala subalpina]|uniref:Uncharacterized protein n=1 Tax=Phialocephala subalpina TaxID=576137 RepID=A0A1L7X3Y3_9HELO|nr:uncharacterized protein PAC_09612 [Phialocephala subalpina]
MSFGYSIGDFITLTQIACNTAQNARKACGAHDNLTRERLSAGARSSVADIGEVQWVVGGEEKCYEAMAAGEVWKWRDVGSGEDKRGASDVYPGYNIVSEHVGYWITGRVEAYMNAHGKNLQDIKRSLNWVTANLQATGSHEEKSMLTTYTEDDKLVWKAFRRELIKVGFSSRLLDRHKRVIKNHVLELVDRGLLSEVVTFDDSLESSGLGVQEPDVDDGSSDPSSAGPSTPAILLIIPQDIASKMSPEEEKNIDNESEEDAEPIVDHFAMLKAESCSGEHNGQKDQGSISKFDTDDCEFGKSQDETCQQATDIGSSPDNLDDAETDTGEDSKSDTSSQLSAEDDFESLAETNRATEKTAGGDLSGLHLLPRAFKLSVAGTIATFEGYHYPSVIGVEDEELLPGTHPNCMHKNNKDYTSILLDTPIPDGPRLGPQTEPADAQANQRNEEEMELVINKQKLEDEVESREKNAAESVDDFERLVRAKSLWTKERIERAAYFGREAVKAFLFFERKYLNASSLVYNEHDQICARDEERRSVR